MLTIFFTLGPKSLFSSSETDVDAVVCVQEEKKSVPAVELMAFSSDRSTRSMLSTVLRTTGCSSPSTDC